MPTAVFPRCLYKYVRQVCPNKFQARIRLGGLYERFDRNMSLGLYETERAAWGAVRATIRELDGQPLTLETVYLAAVRAMRLEHVRSDLLPKYVRRSPCREKYLARVPSVEGPHVTVGVFDDPIEAHRAAIKRLNKRIQPGRQSSD